MNKPTSLRACEPRDHDGELGDIIFSRHLHGWCWFCEPRDPDGELGDISFSRHHLHAFCRFATVQACTGRNTSRHYQGRMNKSQ